MSIGRTLVPIIGSTLQIEKGVVFNFCSEYTDETNSVYFVPPTSPDQLTLSTTHGVFIAKAVKFVMPSPQSISFAEVEAVEEKDETEEIEKAMEDMTLQPPKGVDPSVFAALPRSVQLDVIQQANSSPS